MADPADLVRDALALVGLSDTGNVNTRHTTRFMNANSIESVEDFASLDTSQVKEMVKIYRQAFAQGNMGITTQNRLKGLIWWARDKRRRGQPIDTTTLDLARLEEAREEYEMYLKDVEAGSKVTALEKWSSKVEFSSWDDMVTEILDQRMGAQETSISYVIRPNQPAGFTPRNSKEELKYALPLNGSKYRQDNGVVYNMLAIATLDTLAYTYVEKYKYQLDGRNAMQALRDHYDGDASTNKKLTKYQGIISSIEYTNERTASWESQLTKLIEAYNWLSTRANQSFTDDIKVIKLCAMIKVSGNNALAIAVEYMRNTFRSDFEGAVTYITGRINEINQTKPSAGTRYVSTAARKTSWNGVDISNPERNFKPEEWDKLKDDGQRLVNRYRNEIRNPPREGGRGHGGHGRGGRGRYEKEGRGGRGGRGRGRGPGGRGYGQNAERKETLNRVVKAVVENNKEAINEMLTKANDKIPETASSATSSVTTGSSSKGGQAGTRFQV